MRTARTLVLALATAITAMALGATTAGAQTIHAENEATAEPCEVILQNCKIVTHSTQETVFVGHSQFGFEVTDFVCEDEFTGYLHEDGTGHITNQVLIQHADDTCGKESCGPEVGDGTEGEWDVLGLTEVGAAPEEFEMELRFCLQNIGDPASGQHCTINIHVVQTDHHNAELTAEDEPCHAIGDPLAEVTGHWATEATESDEIQITHTSS